MEQEALFLHQRPDPKPLGAIMKSLGSENDKYAIWCSHIKNKLLGTGTVHDCRSANIVGIRNVNTVLLNGKIVIFKSF